MRIFFVFLYIALLLVAGPVQAAQAAPGEKVWRLALVATGSFKDYQIILQGLIKGLEEKGLIENGNIPVSVSNEGLAAMWEWARKNAGGDRIVFVQDAFYTPNWNQKQRPLVKQKLLERIRKQGDIDLILACGTWVGQDFSTDEVHLPVVVISVSNPVEAGIIASVEDSGRDNLFASVEPRRYERQIRLFHDIFRFRKMGIAYDAGSDDHGTIALAEIEKTARDLRVELARCTGNFEMEDTSLAADNLRACHENLVKQGVDAVYVTYSPAMLDARIPEVLSPLIKARVPTFSQMGSAEVARGVLLSISQANMQDEGRFNAEALAEIINGKRPRDQPQRFESTFSLAVNLRTAALIGWNMPLEILAAMDEFYQNF
jgi:ABC-type uncharacterized transport system substrate-binding protein